MSKTAHGVYNIKRLVQTSHGKMLMNHHFVGGSVVRVPIGRMKRLRGGGLFDWIPVIGNTLGNVTGLGLKRDVAPKPIPRAKILDEITHALMTRRV